MNDNSFYWCMGVDTGAPLLEIDTFALRAWPYHGGPHSGVLWDNLGWDSIITHDCNGNEPNWIVPLNSKPKPCPDCGKVVPEKLTAAWILHNFDRIQERS